MQKIISIVIMLSAAILLSCSNNNQPIVPDISTESGTLKVSLKMDRVGLLGKTKAIEMAGLYVVLSAEGQDTVFDTIQLSGGSYERSVEKVYDNIVSRVKNRIVEWTISLESRDQNDQPIHSGDTTFTITPPKDTVELSITLDAHLSMLVASYYPIRDSVTRCVLRIDDNAVEIDSPFSKQSLIDDTVKLSYDYLSASTSGEPHNVILDVYGDFWGVDTLLYTGDTTITVHSGEDVNYNVMLKYVGPNKLYGAAKMMVTLGKVGMVTINGVLQNNNDSIVTDIDGNVYHTVTIGTQVWMVENLKTTKYNDGTPIPLVTNNVEWANLTTPGYCWFNNDESTHKEPYGAMYNWYTIETGKLAPTGWHVPTYDGDFNTLANYLGGSNVAGGKLKEIGTLHWNPPNTGATNETGFTALPGGYRNYQGIFDGVGIIGYLWSATQRSTASAWLRSLAYSHTIFNYGSDDKMLGFSVRCVKDSD